MTFTAALVFIESSGQFVEGFLVTLLAVLEIPGIIVGLMLASRGRQRSIAWGESLREVLSGRSIVLLVGGLGLGFVTGSAGFASIEPFFGGLFTGVLTLFLLELGIVAGRRLSDELATVLNEISGVLTTEDLIALRTRVEGDEKAQASTAAQEWLEDEGLLN